MPTVFLLRHGEAMSPSISMTDRDRRLTTRGRQDITAQAEYLHRQHPEPLRIIHSPYLRTRETAELVNERFGLELAVMNDLVPHGNPSAVVDQLLGIEEDTLLVTHLPLIADVAALMVQKRLPFFPGTLAEIKRDDACLAEGKLGWFRHPE